MKEKIRCPWCLKDELYMNYHDTVWGFPEHNDLKLFEKLLLDGAQAGLSWYTILAKQENYRRAFDGFNPQKIARYSRSKIERLMQDSGIVRNRLKINAFITNARAYLDVIEKEGSFNNYLWQFTDGKIIVNRPRKMADLPAISKESGAMSKALQKRGFKFCGSTICYAFMQAVGMVDDHLTDCWRKRSLSPHRKLNSKVL